MLLTDSGFYFHLSRLINFAEEYQYMQVLFLLNLDLDRSRPKHGRGDDFSLGVPPKLLGLPSSARLSYVNIKEFVDALHELSYDLVAVRFFFQAFQRDLARSGRFHLDPATWHAFTATRFLRFFATASSRWDRVSLLLS